MLVKWALAICQWDCHLIKHTTTRHLPVDLRTIDRHPCIIFQWVILPLFILARILCAVYLVATDKQLGSGPAYPHRMGIPLHWASNRPDRSPDTADWQGELGRLNQVPPHHGCQHVVTIPVIYLYQINIDGDISTEWQHGFLISNQPRQGWLSIMKIKYLWIN